MSFLDVVIAPSTFSARVLNPLQSLFALGAREYVGWQFFRAGYLNYTHWPGTLDLFANEYHVPGCRPTMPRWPAPSVSCSFPRCWSSACTPA